MIPCFCTVFLQEHFKVSCPPPRRHNGKRNPASRGRILRLCAGRRDGQAVPALNLFPGAILHDLSFPTVSSSGILPHSAWTAGSGFCSQRTRTAAAAQSSVETRRWRLRILEQVQMIRLTARRRFPTTSSRTSITPECHSTRPARCRCRLATTNSSSPNSTTAPTQPA